MSDACTITGLPELTAAVNELPRSVTLALNRVAEATANRVVHGARQRLLSPRPAFKQPGPGYGALAASVESIEDAVHKQYIVECEAPSRYPRNLPIWVEFGTSHMAARPYMFPALQAENATYQREIEAAAVRALQEALR